MRKLPIAYRDLIRELRGAGFERARTRGTHEIWKHDAVPEHVKIPFPPGGSDRMLNGRLPLQALQAVEHARAVAPQAARALPPVIEIPPALGREGPEGAEAGVEWAGASPARSATAPPGTDVALASRNILEEGPMMMEREPGMTKTGRAKETAARQAKTGDLAAEFAEAWANMKQREVAEYFGITELDVQLLVQHWKLPRHKQRGPSRNGPVHIVRTGAPAGETKQRTCRGCGVLFPAHRNQQYHAPACQAAQRERARSERRARPAPGQGAMLLNDERAPYVTAAAPLARAPLSAAAQASPPGAAVLDYEMLAAQVAAQQARVSAVHIDYERLAEAMVRLQVKMFLAWREKEQRGG